MKALATAAAMAATSLRGERSREQAERGGPGLRGREGVSFARERRFSRWREGRPGRGGGQARLLQGPRPPFPPTTLGRRLPSAAVARAAQAPGVRLALRRLVAVPSVPFLSRREWRAAPARCPPSSPPTASGRWRLLSRSVCPGDQEGGGARGPRPCSPGGRGPVARGTRAPALSARDALAAVAESPRENVEEY